jgi:hypothetical protein
MYAYDWWPGAWGKGRSYPEVSPDEIPHQRAHRLDGMIRFHCAVLTEEIDCWPSAEEDDHATAEQTEYGAERLPVSPIVSLPVELFVSGEEVFLAECRETMLWSIQLAGGQE